MQLTVSVIIDLPATTSIDDAGTAILGQEAGYPIGSGAVEREVEVVLNRRMKKQGMRWKRVNADGLAALWVERLNRTWDQATVHQRLPA